LSEQEQADLRAEAKLLTQLLHRNIVQFRGAVFRESQCCLVTELAPHGSLKSVLTRFELPWDLVIKLCVDMASGVQFLHTSGIIHRDIKSDNVLVFSLSPRESVCAKLTDFGSARAGKAHIDATGQIQLGSPLHFSANEGTPIYMAPQLFARTSRPSEASDCYSLGVLFYEVASEREPWADVPFAWNVAKLVMAGQRPTWPEHVVESAPAPFEMCRWSGAMWAQQAETRPRARRRAAAARQLPGGARRPARGV
jgi:serine/threonine protein kinase